LLDEPVTNQQMSQLDELLELGAPLLRTAQSVREWQDALLHELHSRLQQARAEADKPWRVRDPSSRWKHQHCVVQSRAVGKVQRMRRLQRCATATNIEACCTTTYMFMTSG
jgi:hypothetical protein